MQPMVSTTCLRPDTTMDRTNTVATPCTPCTPATKAMTTATTTATATTTVTVEKTRTFEGADADQLVKAIGDFNAAKQLLDELKAQKEAAEAVLREMLGDADAGFVAGVERVRISHRNNSSFDRKLMQTASATTSPSAPAVRSSPASRSPRTRWSRPSSRMQPGWREPARPA